MKVLDYFDRVYILSLPKRRERAKGLLAALRPLVSKNRLEVFTAILGDELPAPGWWNSGNGAWGCQQSHVRILQDAHFKGYEKILVFEDDAVLARNAEVVIAEFLESLPEDWGQVYLGGQHQQAPSVVGGVLKGHSINRTHCYGVHRKHLPRVLQHIQHAPDYISRHDWHVDHQMELGHINDFWPVFAPNWWPVGQGAVESDVAGKEQPERWWDWADDALLEELPWVELPQDITQEKLKPYARLLHLGNDLEEDGFTDRGLHQGLQLRFRSCIPAGVRSIRSEAFSMRRFPAVRPVNERHAQLLSKCIRRIEPFGFREVLDFNDWLSKYR